MIIMLKKLVLLDQQTSRRLRIPADRAVLRRGASIFAHSADSWFWVAGLIILLFTAPPHWRSTLLLLLISIILTAIIILASKFAIKRPRPEGLWGTIYRKSDPHSFPSGHAARAGLIAGIILLTGSTGLGLLLVIWALLVNYARIGLGVHYLSDILVGTLIGILLAGVFYTVWV